MTSATTPPSTQRKPELAGQTVVVPQVAVAAKEEAARMLGVSTKTLYNKLRRYASEVREAKGASRGTAQGADARAG